MEVAAVGWGISTAGWLISPIIAKLLNKVFSYLGFLSLDKLKTLDSKVQQLKQMVEKVEASPHQNARLDQWMKDLKSAFYEVEDILDAIDYHHLKSRILYKSAKQKKQDLNVDLDSREKLSKSLHSLENLVNEGQGLLSSWVNSTANSDKMTNTPTIYKTAPGPPPAVFGRDNDVQKIRGLLRQPGSSTAKCYSVVGIHGLPGSGKTTLAQSVCKVEREVGYFNIVMWIHVSQNFTVEAVTSEMLEAASGERCQLRNLGMLQENLKKKLRGKQFLLVLDDFWNTDVRMLDTLLSPLIAGDSGSKILVTTRFEGVARALGAQNPFPIPEIEEDHFIKMFMHYALDGARNSDQELKEYEIVGRDIARKLRRSPLAARIVAGQLRQRIDINHWKRTLDRPLLNDTLGALWWGYQQLEEHVRQCFRYCIIFPRRYSLEREELVHLWMAEGFLESPIGAKGMEDMGHQCFDILLSCSFIQPEEHSIDIFTIHDLLHDLLEDWRPEFNVSRHAGSACYRIEEGIASEIPQHVRYLFIESYDEKVFQEQILRLENLRTIFVPSTTRPMTKKDLELLLKKLRKLRVVHVYCKGIKMIPKCIGDQKHLRYLGLNPHIYVVVDDDDDDDDDDDTEPLTLTLPSTFTKLYHLQNFSYPFFWVLDPSSHKEMGNLVNLRYMHGLEKLNLAEIGRLTLLRTLHTFTVRKACGYEIHQLEHLDNLCDTLKIEGLQNVGSKEEAQQAKLAKKVHVSELVLSWKTEKQSSEENQDVRKSKKLRLGCGASGSAVREVGPQDPQEEVLEELFPPSRILKMKIKAYSGSSYPGWLSGEQGKLENLRHLEFSECSGASGPSNICASNLRTLRIMDCSWNSLPGNMECLKSLETIEISNCKNILLLPSLPMSLKELTISDWKGTDPCPGIWESLVNLCTLGLKDCSWTSLPGNMERLTSLTKLRIEDCKNIPSLPRLPLSIKELELGGWDEPDATTGIGVGEPLHNNPNWPENMEDLTSLDTLWIFNCTNIHSLPNLPKSLVTFFLIGCNRSLTESCQTDGHPNSHKIADIPTKHIRHLIDIPCWLI